VAIAPPIADPKNPPAAVKIALPNICPFKSLKGPISVDSPVFAFLTANAYEAADSAMAKYLSNLDVDSLNESLTPFGSGRLSKNDTILFNPPLTAPKASPAFPNPPPIDTKAFPSPLAPPLTISVSGVTTAFLTGLIIFPAISEILPGISLTTCITCIGFSLSARALACFTLSPTLDANPLPISAADCPICFAPLIIGSNSDVLNFSDTPLPKSCSWASFSPPKVMTRRMLDTGS